MRKFGKVLRKYEKMREGTTFKQFLLLFSHYIFFHSKNNMFLMFSNVFGCLERVRGREG